jgi:peptide/nickel transport system permease protein
MSELAATFTITRRRRRWLSGSARAGATVGGLVVFLALFGPFFAPHGPTDLIGIPFSGPSGNTLLGTDFLGRDVLSRLLWGGRTVVALAALATLLGYLGGLVIGLAAGYNRRRLDSVLMRLVDVLLSFPPILFMLILATGAGASRVALVAGVATIHVPSIARIIRTATAEVSTRPYVDAAIARGERPVGILAREIFPNISNVVVADAGPRITVSILLVAAMNFLGLGLQPPAADWGLMISENRAGLTIQPLAVLAPAALIGILTICVNLFADAIAARAGRSIDPEAIRR